MLRDDTTSEIESFLDGFLCLLVLNVDDDVDRLEYLGFEHVEGTLFFERYCGSFSFKRKKENIDRFFGQFENVD